MTKAERHSIYQKNLVANGIECRMDEYDDLELVRVDPHTGEVRRFCIILNDNEPFLNVALPAFAKVPSTDGAASAAEALCMAVNAQGGVVKWYVLQDGSMWAAAPIFVPSPEVGCQMLKYCLECIEASFYFIRDIPETRRILDHLVNSA